jgi:hypothetical protein
MTHADILPYLISIIGFLIVYVLYGIKSEIRDVRTSVNSLDAELRGGISSLERRVNFIERRCAAAHGFEGIEG